MRIKRTETQNLKYLDKQRLNHIRVERNRRKHLNANIAILKDMLPPHHLTKKDQASVIGGVVEFIGELNQLLQTLEQRKLRKKYSEILSPSSSSVLLYPLVPSSLISEFPTDGDIFSASRSSFQQVDENHSREMNKTLTYQVNTGWAKVVVTKNQSFVDVLIETLSRPRVLTQIIVALQSLSLHVMQMNIAKQNNNTVRLVIRTQIGPHYKFTMQELAAALHQICRIC